MTVGLSHRQSIRLDGYDYSSSGMYFVTICTQNKLCLFGEVKDGEMILNEAGLTAQQCWLDIPLHFPHVILHEFVIMPNHIHGILEITDDAVGANNHSPDNDLPEFKSPSKTIGSIIRGFKIGVMKWFKRNDLLTRANVYSPLQAQTIWQRNYYEHIIRNEKSYSTIADYIVSNPINWQSNDYYIN